MPIRETTRSGKLEGLPSQSCSFFCFPRPSTVDKRCLELQEDIEKQEKYIAELEDYNLHAKKPIERDIKAYEIYKKKVKFELKKIGAEIVGLEAKINYELCPMTTLPSETSELKNNKIYLNSTTRECTVVKSSQKNADSFYLRKEDLDLSHLNTPGLKSEVLSLILQKGIIKSPSLQKKILEIKNQCREYKAYEARLHKTEDSIIELNQELNCICKQIDDHKKSLSQKRVLLCQLEAELIKTITEPIIQEIEHRFRPLPPGA